MEETETTEEPKPLADMTAAELQAEHSRIVDEIRPIAEKAKEDVTGADQAAKRQAADRLAEIRAEFTARSETIDVDLDALEASKPAEEPAETPDPAAETPEEPQPQSDDDKALDLAAASAHAAAANTDDDRNPDVPAGDKVQPFMIAGVGRANIGGASEGVMRAGIGETPADDWRVQVASRYSQARRAESGRVPVWESQRRSDETPVMTNQASALAAAEIMGLTGDLNRADACNPRYLNETISCVAPEDEAQQWIPKFAMDDECEVRTKRIQDPAAPTVFEWAYDEDFGGTDKTGLVVSGDVPAVYDPADEDTWKPVSALSTTCLEDTWRLRSVGYIREVTRGQDLCDPAAVERAIAQDSAYLEQAKAQRVIAAFDAAATAGSHAHTFDGTVNHNNPLSAVAHMVGEIAPNKENLHGVEWSDATLFLPSNIAQLLGVVRYETLKDNAMYTAEGLAEVAGVNDVVLTRGITMTGSLDITSAAAAAIPNEYRGRTIPMYFSWRAGWRQGQGPGVRGAVSDEKNIRGNKRMFLVEDDLVNLYFGCLSTVKITADLCFVGGHTLGTAPAACAAA